MNRTDCGCTAEKWETRVNVVAKPVALNYLDFDHPPLFPEQAVTMKFLVSIGNITKRGGQSFHRLSSEAALAA